jgi:predicted nucleic acid-binding protein
MGTQHLIDTNATIEFLADELPLLGAQWLQNAVDRRLHYMSVINYIELLSYKGAPTEMQVLEDFINTTTVLPLQADIVEQTIAIRRAIKLNCRMRSLQPLLWCMVFL